MTEQEPKYFTKFREHIDKKFEETNKNFETSIEDLALSVAKQFSIIDQKFDNINHKFAEQEKNLKEYMDAKFATKLDLYETEARMNMRFDKIDLTIEKIEGHIGRYEIRA